jgi:HEAT repeat protein
VRWRARAGIFCLLLAAHAGAQDLAVPKREVISSDDYRIRMSAALILGRSRDASARPLLEQALSDTTAAVRTAAAAALAVLGDSSAIPALERAREHEPSDSTRAQIDASLRSLRTQSSLAGVQLVVQIGNMRNATAIRGTDVAEVLRIATASRARSMPNTAVAMPTDTSMLQRAAGQHLPVLVLDGNVTRLTQARSGSNVTCQAEVELLVRRLSDQSLRGTLTGSAAALGEGTTSARGVITLQDQAIGGAVESALRNASQGLLLAAR